MEDQRDFLIKYTDGIEKSSTQKGFYKKYTHSETKDKNKNTHLRK
jgi:hypothetical protein